jgi:photosystem II stability/assembly factor-like uncharacterized protein
MKTLLVCLTVVVACSVAVGEAWYSITPSPTAKTLKAVHLSSRSRGFAVGAGAFLKTVSSGLSWTVPTSLQGNDDLNAVTELDTVYVFAVGENGRIVYNITSGKRWMSASPVATTLRSIGQTPWVDTRSWSNDDGMGHTDVGNSEVYTYVIAGDQGTIVLVELTHVYHVLNSVASDTAYLQYKTVGGVATPTMNLTAVAQNSTSACIVSETGDMLLTVNNGTNWSTMNLGTPLEAIAWPDGSTIVAVGARGAIRRSTNLGATWTDVSVPTTLGLHAVSFADALTGVAVGDSGLIVKTVDGGITWQQQATNAFLTLHGVYCFDSETGSNWMAVGDSGTVVQTMFKGETAAYELDTRSLDFGTIALGDRRTFKVTVTNTSQGPVTIMTHAAPPFSMPQRVLVDVGGSSEISITFTPSDTLEHVVALSLLTDASLTADTLRLRGRGWGWARVHLPDTVHLTGMEPFEYSDVNDGNLPLITSVEAISSPSLDVTCSSSTLAKKSFLLHVQANERVTEESIWYFVINSNMEHQPDTVHVVCTPVVSVNEHAGVPCAAIYPTVVEKNGELHVAEAVNRLVVYDARGRVVISSGNAFIAPSTAGWYVAVGNRVVVPFVVR